MGKILELVRVFQATKKELESLVDEEKVGKVYLSTANRIVDNSPFIIDYEINEYIGVIIIHLEWSVNYEPNAFGEMLVVEQFFENYDKKYVVSCK